jgi:glycerol-3-phosphate acyltransferase PlsY
MLNILLILILSYLLGSIPFSIIISNIWKGIDIRAYGSKNAGFTNVYRVSGPFPAMIVLLLDAGKGAMAVLFLTQISLGIIPLEPISLKILAGVFAIIGHVFPLFAGFKGGKGIACGLGVMLSLIFWETVFALALFIIIVALTRYVSLASLTASIFLFLFLVFEKLILQKNIPLGIIIACFVLMLLVFFTHRSNIKRLLAGKENKFGQKDMRI